MDNIQIVILSPSEFPGTYGDTVNFVEIINQLLLKGLKVLLICPKSTNGTPSESNYHKENLEIIRINFIPPRLNELNNGLKIKNYINFIWFLLVETITIIRLVRSKGIKKILIRHSILTMHLVIVFKILRVKAVGSIDGEFVADSMKNILNPLILSLFYKYERKILKLYDYFKISSPSQKDILENIGIKGNKVLIIPISIDIDKIPKYDVETMSPHTFGYFGGLEPWQGIDVLIKAFEILHKKIPTSLLYIIGDGSLMNELKHKVKENGLTSNIFFIGKISREKLLFEYFGKFQIAIIPRQKLNNSIDTILPIKLIESLAAYKPIIAINIPVMKDIPENPLLLVQSGNPQELADKMFYLSNNLEELRFRSHLSCKSSKNFDIKENIIKLIDILK